MKWRDGRPRWEPGPRLRALGCRGRDLKDEGGRWLTFNEAAVRTADLNSRFGVRPERQRENLEEGSELLTALIARNLVAKAADLSRISRGNYVYVFVFDGVWAKIGFSTDPWRRWRKLSQMMPQPLGVALVAPGSEMDEKALHRHFAAQRRKNEWFNIAGGMGVWLARVAQSRTRRRTNEKEIPVCSVFLL